MTFFDFFDKHPFLVFFLVATVVWAVENGFTRWCETRALFAKSRKDGSDE